MVDHAAALAEALTRRSLTIAVAESCTGGMVGAAITSLPGSSRFFVGGIIAYSNNVKERLLGVPHSLLKSVGAVSREVASAMAQGARKALETDGAVAITGIAGPEGGSEKKPVGLVYIAACTKSREVVKEFRFTGSRDQIRAQATIEALQMMRDAVTP